MLKTKVIASSITNLTDARYFAAWEVNWLGFCFEEGSDNYISPQAMYAIKEWVDGVKFMGEFRGMNSADILDHVEKLSLEAVQVDELTGLDVMMDLQDILVFKEIEIDETTDEAFLKNILEQFAPYCAHFVFKIKKDLPDHLVKVAENYSVWLDGDFKTENILNANFAGVCLRGGMEEKVGLKSFDELDEVFEVLEVEG